MNEREVAGNARKRLIYLIAAFVIIQALIVMAAFLFLSILIGSGDPAPGALNQEGLINNTIVFLVLMGITYFLASSAVSVFWIRGSHRSRAFILIILGFGLLALLLLLVVGAFAHPIISLLILVLVALNLVAIGLVLRKTPTSTFENERAIRDA
jgi:hypothetical protein